MNINRHNYEEFFLLYVDNELTNAEKKAVEVFVQENPDLEEELVMLQQSVLRPGHMAFENKQSLFKNVPASGLINTSNYQEYFVLYGDNELTNNEKILVEQFVEKHPQFQQEFDLIQQAKLIPDNALVFPDKNDLYRTAADERVIPFPWRKLAVAAVFILFLGGFVWFVSNNKPEGPQVVNKPSDKPNSLAITDTNNKSKTNPVNPSTTDAIAKDEKEVAPKENIPNNTAKTTDNNKKKETIKAIEGKADANDLTAGIKNNYQEKRNNSAPEIVPPVERKESTLTAKVVNNTFASARPVVDVAVSGRTQQETRENLNIQNTQVVYIDEPVDETLYADNSSGNKQRPLRGLFRKVTRVFDKATNADANEPNKKNIRIAAFEIALK